MGRVRKQFAIHDCFQLPGFAPDPSPGTGGHNRLATRVLGHRIKQRVTSSSKFLRSREGPRAGDADVNLIGPTQGTKHIHGPWYRILLTDAGDALLIES